MNVSEDECRYFGKYRATVVNNIDPQKLGRIQVTVSDISALFPTSWAMPCLPFAGKQAGLVVLPQPGDGVWVEFEQGDPDYPIWVGCYYGVVAEVPLAALTSLPVTPDVIIQSSGQNTIIVSGTNVGGITLSCGPVIDPTGPKIEITRLGIKITCGLASINLDAASGTVAINKNALTISV